MPSKAIRTFQNNLNSIFGSYLNRRFQEYLKEFCLLHIDDPGYEDISVTLQQFERIKGEDRTINYLFISIISSMELYLKERLLEQLKADENLVIRFLESYEVQRKLTVSDVVSGPHQLVNEILNGIIYHNVEKVNKIYEIVFGFSILDFVDVKMLKMDIKLRHIIAHSAGKARDKELVIQDGFLFCMNRISNFIESIDYYIENGTQKKRFSNYWARHDRAFAPIRELESFEQATIKSMLEMKFDKETNKNQIRY